jgi:hypothetical protein
MRIGMIASIAMAAVLVVPVSVRAEKLKGFYVGSGGITEEVSRIVIVEFANDGTAIVQQNWVGKDPQTWHAHWKQDGSKVTVTFDAVKDQAAMDPLLMTFKRGTLTPTSWDTALGVLGPPKLAPFSGQNVRTDSVAGCRSLSPTNAGYKCVQWDSRDSGK